MNAFLSSFIVELFSAARYYTPTSQLFGTVTFLFFVVVFTTITIGGATRARAAVPPAKKFKE